MKIVFLLNNAYGIGGTIRSVSNLSAALAARHSVTIASTYRHRDAPSLAFDPRVRIDVLTDQREGSPDLAHPGAERPSEALPDVPLRNASRLTDARIAAYLARTDADVVISTRPVLSAYLARFGNDRHLRVGQEHSTLRIRGKAARALQFGAVGGLDAFCPVSATDAQEYREALPEVATRIESIPNSSPRPRVSPSTGDSRTIVAAGRLVNQKRYDRLLDAFAKLAPEFPDWRLRIYGRGVLRDELAERIERLGLSERARLMGAVSPIDTEWAKAAIAAVSSYWESFGLTIVEAMACGVPVVATDCPHGPREIIAEGEDGLLVPMEGGSDAIAEALRRLMADDALRARMAERALAKAAAYEPDVIARRYEELFESLRPGILDRPSAPDPAPLRAERKPAPTPAPARAGASGGRGGARPAGLRARVPASVRRRVRGLLPAPVRLRLRALPGRLSAPAPARDSGAVKSGPLDAAAHCAATAEGGFTVALTPAVPGELLLRLRHDPGGREVRLPVGADGTATLAPDALPLAEGRWDCYFLTPGRRRARVRAELVEGARLVTLRPAVREDGVTAWIPYTTRDGNLTVRTWQRPAHAEVEEIDTTGEAGVVVASLLAVDEEPRVASAVAVPREGGGPDIDLPVRALGDGRLQVTVPWPEVAASASGGEAGWGLRLRAEDGTLVPVGRIGGDTVDRRRTDAYPAAVHASTELRLHYTMDNELVLAAAPATA
ncbi:glycosyltransferase family 4 protein [Streptomyces sp. DSM 44917]|uniref:D-inositol 3-phosphate glycosyltransferase n=1 Tax=Streptomyces boetiae TaxID=3075541 RepID=A0ABU2L7L2_9ACTN|nr:glycosyltransferase family 4 protein [Streptomyces sp. DSM 44917]MDT0307570.1 glycosyltransferase family 4 protein [Streptomyces sp. DSM 44917]